jgi:copper chaperone CopZ
VSAYLRKHGASKASTSSFLISTPQTGIDSIFITYSLLGPILAIYRPIVALFSGILGGGLSLLLDKDDDDAYDIDCEDECCIDEEGDSSLLKALHYGFIRLPLDIVNPLIFGLVLSAIFSIFIPSNYFEAVGTGFAGMIIMLFLGLPTYVCATASVPIAFVLYTKGFSLGAVLVFLMTGPATNITTISVCWKILGKKSTLIYLFTIIVSSIAAGLLLDWALPNLKLTSSSSGVNHLLSSSMYDLCGFALCIVMINALRIKLFSSSKIISGENDYNTIKVEGMTCSHCEESIVKTIMKLQGVENVFADAKKGEVRVLANDNINQEINATIIQLGFKVIDD